MKNSDIVNLSTEDIAAQILEERATLSKLKFAHAVSAIENPMRIKNVRRIIARLQTELNSRNQKQESETAAVAK